MSTRKVEAELVNLIDELRALGAYTDAVWAEYLMVQAKGFLPELLELKDYATAALKTHKNPKRK